MKLSAEGSELLKLHEGCELEAYPDTGRVWTIGYGHTRGVKKGDKCTQEQADEWLLQDVAQAELAVNSNVTVPLTQNQFDALVSFTYNVGRTAFAGSTLLRRLNAGNYTLAAAEFDRWIYDDSRVVNGLVARRHDEKLLFLTGIGD